METKSRSQARPTAAQVAVTRILWAAPSYLGPASAAPAATVAITDRYVSYDGVNEVLHQHFGPYTTTWGLGGNLAAWSTKTTTVTSTDLVTGQTTITTYTYAPGAEVGSGQVPVEQQIVYQDGGGKTWKTVNKTWEDVFRLIGEQVVLDNGQGKASLHCYNGNSQISDVYEYGFQGEGSKPPDPACATYSLPLSSGLTSAIGPLRRHTAIAYHSFLNTNIVNEPDGVTVYDGSGNQIKQSSFVYDGSSPVPSGAANLVTPAGLRGNLTSATRWLNTGTSPTTTYVHYDTGQVQSITDPCGNTTCSDMTGSSHATSYSYADSYVSCGGTAPPVGGTNAYLTQITDPLGHMQKFCYGYTDGQLRSSTDPNGQTTIYKYTDVLARLTETDYPDAGKTTLSYNDATYNSSTPSPSVTTTKAITTTPSAVNLVTIAAMDGLGHSVESLLTSDPDGTTYGVKRFDGLGRPYQTYNPTRCTTPTTNCGETTWGLTTSFYDALGRTCLVAPPDGTLPSGSACATQPSNDVFTSYSGNIVTVTDQAGKSRKSVSDGLGRLTQVFEDPAGLNYETDYAYDALDNLLSVNQKGGSTNSAQWRTRTFTYDSLSRLLTAANPESGTISYTYDANGNLIYKTSPAPNQTGSATVTLTYCHDALNRLTAKAYTQQTCTSGTVPSPTATYLYDQTSYNGLTIANGIGRRTGMTDQAGSEAWSYDSMGRIAVDRRTTNGLTRAYSYAYNLDGSLYTVTHPDALVVTFTPGGAGRPISEVSGDAGYATNVHYAPNGSLCYAVQGWGTTTTLDRTFNNRFQPIRIFESGTSEPAPPQCASPTQTSDLPVDFTYSYADANGHNNGNVAQITSSDWRRTLSLTYDSLNRVATAKTGATNQPAYQGDTISIQRCWGEQFGYDPWGNLLSISSVSSLYTGCTQENLSLAVNTKNQIIGDTYDSAGNLIIAQPGNFQYTYDAENHLTATSGQTYLYDGDGKRVEKASGSPLVANKLYWYGTQDSPIIETDAAGNELYRYFSFAGLLVAREEANDWVDHYGLDALGNVRWLYSNLGAWDIIDYYPFGGERLIYSTSAGNNTRLFTGKERDSESGNDNFGARYYASTTGRFLSPDWSAAPMGEPYADFSNPQTLNLYAYVKNNPLTYVDRDGHCGEPVTFVVCVAIGVGAIALTVHELHNWQKGREKAENDAFQKSYNCAMGSGGCTESETRAYDKERLNTYGEDAIKAIENTVPDARPSTSITDVVIDQAKGKAVDAMVDSAKKTDDKQPNKEPQPKQPNQQPSMTPNAPPPPPQPPPPPPCAGDIKKPCGT